MKHIGSLPALGLAAALVLLAGCGASQAPIDAQIDDIIRPAHESGKFNGTVLVTRKDQTVYERSYGLADAAKNVPNSADTRFLAFSVLKPLTAVLVFQQIDAGKLRLTDTLDSFFPNLSGKPAGQLTLQQTAVGGQAEFCCFPIHTVHPRVIDPREFGRASKIRTQPDRAGLLWQRS